MVTLILDVTSAGKEITAAEVRQRLNISIGQMNGQLGVFSRWIKTEIAPEWVEKYPSPRTSPLRGTSAEDSPSWHWPFGWKIPADGGSLIYYMPEQVRRIWLSLEAA